MNEKLIKKILNINVNMTVIFTEIEINIQELWDLEVGKMMKLNKQMDSPSIILINNQNVGIGEIFIKNSKFAIKINQLNFNKL